VNAEGGRITVKKRVSSMLMDERERMTRKANQRCNNLAGVLGHSSIYEENYVWGGNEIIIREIAEATDLTAWTVSSDVRVALVQCNTRFRDRSWWRFPMYHGL
jgi:hypothetical protein